MTYVITQNCCKDASCVSVCPVDCIRPVGGAANRAEPQMLYIDPETCVDCGACEVECPVDAIYYEDDLPRHLERYRDINADYFARHPLIAAPSLASRKRDGVQPGTLRVGVVGTGPAACYVVQELIDIEGVEVDVYERLPTPFGLIRAGVAPDHQRTKSITDMFSMALANPQLRCHFNVEIGEHLTHDDLMAHHHAVIYGVGASRSRDLGIPGEHLAGSETATDFVGWYNGHPDYCDASFDLAGERAVIIGNGNVALDVARVLLMEQDSLRQTDIAPHALNALAHSRINEVVIIGRRGPRDAAFSAGEFLALGHLPGVDVIVDSAGLEDYPDHDIETALKLEIAREYVDREQIAGNKRIVFRFLTSPVEFVGTERVEGVRIVPNALSETGQLVARELSDAELIEASLALRSIGYTGRAVPGLPFDETEGRIPNDCGRVRDQGGETVTGVYVTGWIKRGPEGVIGTNRTCAQETVTALWEDYNDGRLSRDVKDAQAIESLLAERKVQQVDWNGWCAIDAAERERGLPLARPRVKVTDTAEMLAIANG